MKVKLFECPKPTCRYRWVPRVDKPKECPNCKHRFSADWGLEPKVKVVEVCSKDEFRKLKADILKWNDEDRWA